MSEAVKEQKPIAIVSLEMGSSVEEIRVYEGEDVQLLTELFCQRFGLGEECVEYIVQQINEQIRHREQSPRFRDVVESFGQMKPSQSKQSDVGLTTEASSQMDAESDKKHQSQLKWEMWQEQIKSKTNPQSAVLWNLPLKNESSASHYKKPSANERLYQEGRDLQKMRNEYAEEYKNRRNQIEMEQATFHPAISPRSRELASKKKQFTSATAKNIGQQLYERGKLKMQKEPEKAPPKKVLRSKSPFHDKLYTQGVEGAKKKEQWAQEQFSKICPFKPKSKSPIRSVSRTKQQDQVQRLYQEQEDRKRKLEQKKQNLLQNRFEYQTQNQSTFHPKITKDVHYLKVSKKTDYEDTQLAQDIQKLHSRLITKESTKMTLNQKPQASSQSQSQASLISQRSSSDNALIKIFNQLDGDKDGLISPNALDLSTINADTLEIISEALYQMEDENLTLNIQQFKELCLNLNLINKLII